MMDGIVRGVGFILLCSLASVFGRAHYALAEDFKLPVPKVETLANGMQVAWFTSDRLPIVDIALLVKSGYRDDPKNKSGTAQLVSSVLDRGNGGLSHQQVVGEIEKLGASHYASSDDDSFSVGIHGLWTDADQLLGMLANIVLKPEFPEKEVLREKDRLLDRWSHVKDYSSALASLVFSRSIHSGTSYGRGGFWKTGEFSRIQREDLVKFHKHHFVPKNSILMVVGRVDQVKFREKIIKTFGFWTGEAPPKKYQNYSNSDLLPGKGKLGVVVHRPGLNQAQVQIGFQAPLVQDPDHYALVVGNALLGEYFQSRLNALIRDKLGLTYGISSSFSYSVDTASLVIGSSTRNETVGMLVEKTFEVLKTLQKGPIPDEEVKQAKDYLIGGFPLSMSTLGAVASRWLAGRVFQLGPEYLNEYIPRVKAITAEQVLKAMRKHIHLKQPVVVIAGEKKAILKSLAQVKQFKNKFKVIDGAQLIR